MDHDRQQKVFSNDWSRSVLCDPVTKSQCHEEAFRTVCGVVDARISLKNTYGYEEWKDGQESYEAIVRSGGAIHENNVEAYRSEIEWDRPIYEYFQLEGKILDVGGGVGTIREFLTDSATYLSIDPYINGLSEIPQPKIEAYSCLRTHLNFIGGVAEFLPVISREFDWVHMRSMLDHVQVPDLALMEARRVLKDDGRLLVGLFVEGGKRGKQTVEQFCRDKIAHLLSRFGVKPFRDHHTWHPTYRNLVKLITDNGFEIRREYWQPHWKDQVVYLEAVKK